MKRLVDVCDFQGGSQPPKKEWISESLDGYVRMLQIRDFTQSKKIVPEFVKKNNKLKLCTEEDILIARYGASLGKILTGLSGAYNVAMMKAIPNKTVLTERYLYYYLNSPYFQQSILNVGNRAAQAGFNKTDLTKLEINCRTINAQNRIVKILDENRQIIHLKKMQITKLDNLIKARFVEMFGDPVINNKNIKNQKLGDVCFLKAGEFTSSKTISPVKTSINKYPCFGGNGIRGYVNNYTHQGNYSLIGRQGALCGNVKFATGKFRNTEHAILVSPKIEINSRWLFELLNLEKLNRFKSGAAQPGLAVKTLNEVTIPVPDLKLQNEFANFVQQVDKSKVAVQKSLDETQRLFDSLMQEYFG